MVFLSHSRANPKNICDNKLVECDMDERISHGIIRHKYCVKMGLTDKSYLYL